MASAIGQIAKRFALPHWHWYASGAFFLLGTTWITISIPKFSKTVVNELLGPKAGDTVLQLILLIIGLGITQIIIRSLSRLLLFWPGRKIESEIKNFYFDHFLDLPLAFFNKHPHGDLISRLANDVAQIRACFAFAVLQICNLCFLFSFAVYSMLQVNVHLTLATLLPLLCMIVVSRLGAPLFHKYSKLGQGTLGDLTNTLTETFMHVEIIQANDAITSFLDRISQKVSALYKANIQLVLVRTVMFPIAVLFTGLSYLIVLFYGGREVIAGHLTVGDILAFNIYVSLLSFPLTALGIIMALIQRASAASERLIYLDTQTKEKSLTRAELKHSDAKVPALLSVRHLNYAFGSERNEVLKELSFELTEGSKIGITGPIGSGKSTLLHLITRLYDPPPGSIFFRGQDILSISPELLREQVGLGFQSAYFFSSSIRDNLSLGLNHIPSASELDASARKAQILEEIQGLDLQWETLVGERGVRLSGGQKQRLALARLFLRKYELLLLDDVTAAVDQSTEQRILRELRQDKSSFVIVSHRPAALQICDEVLLLIDGKIAERGSYAELLKRHPQLFTEHERSES